MQVIYRTMLNHTTTIWKTDTTGYTDSGVSCKVSCTWECYHSDNNDTIEDRDICHCHQLGSSALCAIKYSKS